LGFFPALSEQLKQAYHAPTRLPGAAEERDTSTPSSARKFPIGRLKPVRRSKAVVDKRTHFGPKTARLMD
jgi:hypothetical protein